MRSAADVVKADLANIVSRLHDEFNRMSARHLVLVGGAGFLGYYLTKSVLYFNDTVGLAPIRVTLLDNFRRGRPHWLDALKGRGDLRIREHDVLKPVPATLEPADYIVHAASIASPIIYRKHPIATMDANVTGLRNLLDYAASAARGGMPLAGFLYFSTSEIYGDPPAEAIPTPESYRGNVSCTGPRACYDESKRYGETLCVNFARQLGVPVRVARPFNNYGPGLKLSDGRVIPDFARDILAGRDIVLLSDGLPTRTFCYIADAITGYYKILVRGRSGEAYNIGVERPEVSMVELAERMGAAGAVLFGYRGKVVRATSPDAEYLVDNPNRRCPVIAKARAELGYEPRVDLDDGLRRSLLWYAGEPPAEAA